MPQISQIAATYASQIFWLLVTFGFVFVVIGLGMMPKIESTVEARDKRISDDLDAAKAAHARADQIEEEYRAKTNENRAAAQKITLAAKGKAVKDAEKRLAKADGEIADRLAVAEARIAEATGQAMTEIEVMAAEAALEMVSKVSGAKANSAAATKAVKAALANG
ncbi:F0F1 ATP synthase subunit B family protein [Rhizorhapis suberifaciens]|uniref:ATP synthase subunit b n=1 Tax=Rhizorhapis suberifaciens TaxID=13656 RepID=A0A840HWY5_9SPHN|nr:ATPase [Rhizorhapis suberifaciens]MBB4642161.1 F-type H+-transporting ATPase subunit b [Rhizorhapis suberifaciens]